MNLDNYGFDTRKDMEDSNRQEKNSWKSAVSFIIFIFLAIGVIMVFLAIFGIIEPFGSGVGQWAEW